MKNTSWNVSAHFLSVLQGALIFDLLLSQENLVKINTGVQYEIFPVDAVEYELLLCC